MNSEDQSSEEVSATKKHGRNPSYNRPLPRRSTKGPLDADDPLTSTSDASPAFQDDSPPKQPTRSVDTDRDFSFLLQPSIYQAVPPPFPPGSPAIVPAQHPREAFRSARYYSAAVGSAQRLTQPPSPPPEEIFELIYIRLFSLVKLRHLSIAHTESVALGDVNASFYKNDSTGSCLIPWRLRVLIIRLLSDEASDARARQNTLAGLYELAREARLEYKTSGSEIWKQRLSDLALMTVNVLIEAAAYEAALRQMERMKNRMDSEEWILWMTLTYLRCGDADAAERILTEAQLAESRTQHVLTSIVRLCQGDYGQAKAELAGEQVSGDDAMENIQALANFYAGNMDVCLEILERRTSKTAASLESIFNLATCYELMADQDVKRRKETLVKKVGQSVNTGEEMFQPADFKL